MLVGVLSGPLRLVHLVLAAGAQVVHVARLQREHKPRDPSDGEHGVLALDLVVTGGGVVGSGEGTRGRFSSRVSNCPLSAVCCLRCVRTLDYSRVQEIERVRSACGRGQARTVLWTVLLRGQHVVVSSVIVV